MKPVLLIDFGSTYTKVTAVDVEAGCLLGTADSFTTIHTDIGEGLEKALKKLHAQTGELAYTARYACSSAAGGLRMITSGLVPELTWELLDFAFDGYKLCRLLHDGQSLYQFTVANGENQVVGQSATAMDAVLPGNARMKNLLYKYNVKNGGLTAPIAKGQTIATLQIWYQNSCIAETDLQAMSEVRAISTRDMAIRTGASGGGGSLGKILAFVGIVCLVILIPFVIYLIINNVRRALRQNRRRRRRRSRRRSR